MTTWTTLRILATVVFVLALSSCDDGTPSVIVGEWGGEGVSIVVTDVTRFEFDCANGVVEEVLDVSTSGRFGATGTYNLEGGPVPMDPPPGIPAQYRGSVSGDRMSLEVQWLDGSGTTIGPLELRKGEDPILRKCL